MKKRSKTNKNKKQWICKLCLSSFDQKIKVKEHISSVHKEKNSLKFYTCSDSDTSQKNLINHIKSGDVKNNEKYENNGGVENIRIESTFSLKSPENFLQLWES